MSEKFKGKSGGDPSRRPMPVMVSYCCAICNKPGSAKTNRPQHFQPPKTCSTDCASALIRQEAESLIRSVLGKGGTSKVGSISQRTAEEVLTANNWMVQAETGKNVRTVRIICAHCGQASENFTTAVRDNRNVSRFCSVECKSSNHEGLPSGVVCRSPRKASHTTFEESQVAAENMTAQLLLEGDSEGVTPYLCSCGKWHVGHSSKDEWLIPAQEAVTFMTARTMTLLQEHQNLRKEK